jgi:hypothetical protein
VTCRPHGPGWPISATSHPRRRAHERLKSYCESQRGTLFRDEELAGAVKTLREEGRLTFTEEDAQLREPRVVCSPGLIAES